jgi:thioredoxin reductase (NADPH)
MENLSSVDFDCLIVGSGPAGLTAAIYQVRANLKTVLIAGNRPGGQLTITTKVENWPGFSDGVNGLDLMMEMQKQTEKLGTKIIYDLVENIKMNPRGVWETKLQSGEKLRSKVVIIATGANTRWLGVGEERLMGNGVSGCATCDGAFFKDKLVAVVGGGDSAVEEAVFLTRFAKKVYLIHRRDSLRAKAKEQERLMSNPKIEIIWNTQVVAVYGQSKLEGLKIKSIDSEEKDLPIDGLFVAIGGDPATSFVKDLLELKETGHIVVGSNLECPTMTNVPGVFAAGDCVDSVYKQAITSAGDGCRAALDSQKWLEENSVEG